MNRAGRHSFPRGTALRSAIILAAAALLGVAGWFGARAWWRHQELYPSTDDALLEAHVVLVRPQVSGPVISVPVVENQFVKAGDLLFQIDPRPFEQALAQAKADVVLVRTDVAADRATLDSLASAVQAAKGKVAAVQAEVTLAQVLLDDVKRLAAGGEATPKEVAQRTANLESATGASSAAQASLAEAQANLDAAKVRIGDPTYEQARIARAEAIAAAAAINLEYASVKAPTDGWITQFDLRVGQMASPDDTLFYLVEEQAWWIEANFKETQVSRIAAGQIATFTVDMYPGRSFSGTVESISRGAAAAFTLLPPENTTGNWVKVTQRVPVRIRVQDSASDAPFRKGASAEVTIDTVRPPATGPQP